MNNYTSAMTFLYYKDFDKAIYFFEEVLRLKLVMDQGFARVYQVAKNSFLGCVKKEEGSITSENKGGALVSLNTSDVNSDFEHVSKFDLPYISEVKLIEQIPLRSFFFKDYEGYDFEIQEFVKKEDKDFF